VNWSDGYSSLVCLFGAAPRRDATELPNHHVLIMLHAGSEPYKFTIPKIARGYAWWLFIDTAAHSPRDIYPDLKGPSPPASGVVQLEGRSLMCFVAREEI
jgi:glycogen operon protein